MTGHARIRALERGIDEIDIVVEKKLSIVQ
jgi:hypothetical protein